MLSQMNIAKPSMTIVELNNVVVTLRTKVKKARAQVIQRLVKQIKSYRTKKGSEAQIAENNKRADRLYEEILLLKKANIDHIAKHCLANKSTVEQVSSQIGSESMANLHVKSYTRIACHKLMSDAVAKWREGRDDWEELAAFLQSKNTGRRYKKKKKLDGGAEVVSARNENEKVEKSEQSACGVENRLGSMLEGDDSGSENTNETNNNDSQGSESDSEDNQDHLNIKNKSLSKSSNADNVGNDTRNFPEEAALDNTVDGDASDDEIDDGNANDDFDSENASYDDDSESENSAMDSDNDSDNENDSSVEGTLLRQLNKFRTEKPSSARNSKHSGNVGSSAMLNTKQLPSDKGKCVPQLNEKKCQVASSADEPISKAGKGDAVIRRLNLESLAEDIEELPIVNEKQHSNNDIGLDESEPTAKKRKKDSFFLREGKDSDATSSEDELSEEKEDSDEDSEKTDGENEMKTERKSYSFDKKQRNSSSDFKRFNKVNNARDFQKRQPKRAWERNQSSGKNSANRNKNFNSRQNKSDRSDNSRGRNGKNFGHKNLSYGHDGKNSSGKSKQFGAFKKHQPPVKPDVKSGESEKPIHPSWEASRKRKEEQTKIVAFAGKKIKFDDD